MKYLLIIICILLSCLIYYQIKFYSDSDYELPSNMSNLTYEEIDNDDEELSNIREYETIIKRPLFSLDRRPPKVKAQILESSSSNIDELEELVVYGVVKSGTVAYAIIGNMDGQSEGRQVKAGVKYRGWIVNEITSDSVKFVGDGLEYELLIIPHDSTSGKQKIKRSEATSQNKNTVKAYKSKKRNENAQKQAPVLSSGGLIYNRAKKKTPIKATAPNQSSNTKPLSESEINELQERGGYSYEPDDEIDIDDYEE